MENNTSNFYNIPKLYGLFEEGFESGPDDDYIRKPF